MKEVTGKKYQNTMAWPKSTGQKFLPLHKIPERPRKTLDTQNSLAVHQLYFCLWDEVTATWIMILIWNRAITGQDQTSSESIYSAATQVHTSTGSWTSHQPVSDGNTSDQTQELTGWRGSLVYFNTDRITVSPDSWAGTTWTTGTCFQEICLSQSAKSHVSGMLKLGLPISTEPQIFLSQRL